MTSLYLSDIMRRVGLNPDEVMLIRHSLGHRRFKKCYLADEVNKGIVQEYTRQQAGKFAIGAKSWLVFISGNGTTARFYGCYKVTGAPVKSDKSMANPLFPLQEVYEDDTTYLYPLAETDIMSDMKDRLIIEWGKGTTAWYQWGYNEKEVISIQMSQKKTFEGFDTLILSYDELKEIVEDPLLYENWHTAMSSVYAIYLISDRKSGKLYVGSASGAEGGLLARWTEYVKTGHGGNVRMKELKDADSSRCHDFQFSILQILPKTMVKEDVIKVESLWKNKLLSREFGMNDN